MPLNDRQLRALSPAAKSYKKADGLGLYIEVTPRGSKLWRVKYRFGDKEKRLSLGRYPEVSLAEARRMRDEIRALIRSGIDPSRDRQRKKAEARVGSENSFATLAEEYIQKMFDEGKAEATLRKARWFLSLLKPTIGRIPVGDVEPRELLSALKIQEKKGNRETAKKCRSFASRVFRYAVQTGRASNDPAELLKGALLSPKVQHYAAILDPDELSALLKAIDAYSGYPSTRLALQIAPHVFLRPGELRQADWSEIDLQKCVWEIPASRMKARKPHKIPLSAQVVRLLADSRSISDRTGFVFPAFHKNRLPLSENTLNQALRRMGFSKEMMTAHGFRSTASTMLNESGLWHPDVIERALAHADRDQVRAAYNRGQYWEERVRMAQWWSDYLDELRGK